jgi:hypothetical protein
MGRRFLAAAFSVAVLVLLGSRFIGCGSNDCCPIGQPSCNCFPVGGSRRSGLCTSICDAPPTGWRRTNDQNGCPVLVQDQPTGSCLQPPHDAGMDAAGDAGGGDG